MRETRMRIGQEYVAQVLRMSAAIVVAMTGVACSNLTGGDRSLPAGTSNPSDFNSVSGALQMRNAALYQFVTGLQQYTADAGLLTDELVDKQVVTPLGTSAITGVDDPLDQRRIPEGRTAVRQGENSYVMLQTARGGSSQALGALEAFAPGTPTSLRAELHAVKGYTELLLADLFCSGVPLSTLDFQGDYTYHAGSTTRETYAAALAEFDTAVTLAGDSTRILNFALVGKGRVLLDLDSVEAAAAVVRAVPSDFVYSISAPWGRESSANPINSVATVSDHEGTNGLAYRTGGDPRTPVIMSVGGTPDVPIYFYFPAKYASGGSVALYAPIVVASGIEARLIQAEASLRAQDYPAWIGTLNTLRQTATVAGQTGPLGALSDPGPSPRDSARIALQFNERAMWFFADGHRQGDLRRLVRNYNWPESAVYPIGTYLAFGFGQYGSDVNAPIPSTERSNPLFHGCKDRNA